MVVKGLFMFYEGKYASTVNDRYARRLHWKRTQSKTVSLQF